MKLIEWAEREIELADDKKLNYGVACYESALRAFKTLVEDGHSGGSIEITKNILNRLIEGKPLTPIDGAEDDWTFIYDTSVRGMSCKVYKCKRMFSLFKMVYEDGCIRYCDNNRIVTTTVHELDSIFHSSFVSQLMDNLFPITMPYMPDKPFMVYIDDSVDNLMAVLYVTKPNGDNVDIYRYFEFTENGHEEIDVDEYEKRKEAFYAGT